MQEILGFIRKYWAYELMNIFVYFLEIDLYYSGGRVVALFKAVFSHVIFMISVHYPLNYPWHLMRRVRVVRVI